MFDVVNLTSADFSSFLSSISTFPAGFKLEGFAEGDAMSFNAVNIADMVKGVDGGAGYWYLPNTKEVTINLMPSTESTKRLLLIAGYMEAKKQPDLMQLVVTVPSMEMVFTFTDGVLVSYPPAAPIQSRLGNVQFAMKFSHCTAVPI